MIDSLVATVPPHEVRHSVAYGRGDVIAEGRTQAGLTVRMIFTSFDGVSFIGPVEHYPALKDIGAIRALYIGEPGGVSERGSCR